MGNCRNCNLAAKVMGADLDDKGICRPCRDFHQAAPKSESVLVERRADLERALKECRGQGEYDCLLALSGGKDSCYLAYKLKVEYGLKVLAYTYSNHNAPECAGDSVKRTVDKLDLDHIHITEPRSFYRKLYRFLLQNQEERGAEFSVCYNCGSIREGHMLRIAVEKRIPLVIVGFSPGQPDPSVMEYEVPRARICEMDHTPKILKDSGLFDESDLSRYWNPARYPAGTKFPRYLAPLHAWDYDQGEVISTCVNLGLIKDRKSANPINSNCRLIWLLMYSDLMNLGHNTYSKEFSRLIREGKASLMYWKIITPILNWMVRNQVFYGRHVRDYMKWLGLKPEDLRITREADPLHGGVPHRRAEEVRVTGELASEML